MEIMNPHPTSVETPSAAPVWRHAHRSAADHQVAGVCVGIARRIDVDPLLVRALAVVLALSAGAGVVAYAAAWLLMPDESGTSVADRHLPGLARRRTGTIVAVILTVYLFTLPLWTSITPFGVGPLVVIGVLAWMAKRTMTRASAQSPVAPAAVKAPPGTLQGSPTFQSAPASAPVPRFDPYQAAPTVSGGPARPPGRPHRSWWLTLAMVMTASAVAVVGASVPVHRPLLLALASALGVIGVFELVGTLTRRPHLGPLFGIVVAVSLAATALTPVLDLPTRVVTGQSATSIWDDASDLGNGVTMAGTSARIDASDLKLNQDARTTVAVLGADVDLVTPADANIVVTTDIRGGSVIAPEGGQLRSGQTATWQQDRAGDEPTLTVHLRVYGGQVRLVNPS